MFPSGGGFCSTVALSIASAARRQGWKGVGEGGGSVAIAEAIAEQLKAGGSGGAEEGALSSIAVASNGFINFEASCIPSCSPVSNLSLRRVAITVRHARYRVLPVVGPANELNAPNHILNYAQFCFARSIFAACGILLRRVAILHNQGFCPERRLFQACRKTAWHNFVDRRCSTVCSGSICFAYRWTDNRAVCNLKWDDRNPRTFHSNTHLPNPWCCLFSSDAPSPFSLFLGTGVSEPRSTTPTTKVTRSHSCRAPNPAGDSASPSGPRLILARWYPCRQRCFKLRQRRHGCCDLPISEAGIDGRDKGGRRGKLGKLENDGCFCRPDRGNVGRIGQGGGVGDSNCLGGESGSGGWTERWWFLHGYRSRRTDGMG